MGSKVTPAPKASEGPRHSYQQCEPGLVSPPPTHMEYYYLFFVFFFHLGLSYSQGNKTINLHLVLMCLSFITSEIEFLPTSASGSLAQAS